MKNKDYCVRQYALDNGELKFRANMSGMGNNKNTWNYTHSKRTAQKYARILNATETEPELRYFAEDLF